jgi:putative endonuclease
MESKSHLDIGQIGEKATLEFYKKQGFKLIEMNYWKPFGEIDVIVKREGVIVFVEVKSLSCIEFNETDELRVNPAENIHPKKKERLRKTIQAFLGEQGTSGAEWRFDVAIVQVNTRERIARVECIEDCIL